jgi:hypothetical protein
MFACQLGQLGLDAGAFEARQVVDEDLSLQVIQLVLDAYREEAVGLELERLAVTVERAHGDTLGALHLVEDARHRQAAFLAFLGARRCDDLGIDEHAQRVVGLGDVDDDHALVDVDLGGGQPDAGRGVHRRGHVVDQFADARVDFLHRLGDGVEARIGVVQDIEYGHKKLC